MAGGDAHRVAASAVQANGEEMRQLTEAEENKLKPVRPHVMIVGGGLLQVEAVRAARELGLGVIVVDADPLCACALIADRFYCVSTKDSARVAEIAVQVKDLYNLAGVFTEGASVEYTVAVAAHKAGLPGIHPEVAYKISNKAAMRKALEEAGVEHIAFGAYVADDFEGAKFHWGGWEYPIVVKAVDNSASRGLTKLKDGNALTKEVFDLASRNSSDGSVLIEECLIPDSREWCKELSTETVWYDGKGYWLGAVDREFIPGTAVETAVHSPAMHDPKVMQKVIDLVLEAGWALGMTTGIFKVDVMLTEDGPRILETTARLSGGFDSQYLTPMAKGADYIKGALKLALGGPIDWNCFIPRWHSHAIAKWLFLPKGTIKSIEAPENIPGEALFFSRVKVGDQVGDYTDCGQRSAVVVAVGSTSMQALWHANEWIDKIDIEVE